MSTTYTDLQLQRFLASCLSEEVIFEHTFFYWKVGGKFNPCTKLGLHYPLHIRETEWLQIVWEVEEKLTQPQISKFYSELSNLTKEMKSFMFARVHATWQQRTIALAQALGRRIETI